MKVYGVCRLVNEPELTMAGQVKKCKFTVAAQRNFKNAQGQYDSDFINCVAWRNQAEFISNYAKKGSQVFIEGTWQTGKYQTSDGRTVYTNDLIVEQVKLLDKRESASEPTKSASQNELDDFMNTSIDLDSDELPF